MAAALLGAVLLGAGPMMAPNPYARMVILESKRSLGGDELARYLASSDEPIAVRAALAVGRTKREAGAPVLAPYLHDPRIPVRAMTVYGLGLIAARGYGSELTAALGDPAGAVKVAALDALARYAAAGAFGSPAETEAAQAAIVTALRKDNDPIVRARSATALVEFKAAPGAAQAAAALVAALPAETDRYVRWHIMWTLFRGYAPNVTLNVLTAGLRDPDELVRIEAVRAIARYKDPSLVAAVRPLLADASWRVQEQAAETIRVLQGKKMTEHLTAIPGYVHVPKPQPDPFAGIPAVAAGAARGGKPSAPTVDDAILFPHLDPATSSAMTSPAPGRHPRVRIVTTKGNLYVVLYPEWAPLAVANFLDLAARGYYNHNRWFRIVPDFVVQTGDPHDNGEGDAGYTIPAEENPLEQKSYVISMGLNYDDKTNTPIRDSAGTQYYVTLSPQLHLDRDFTVYGSVFSGFDVLGRLIESDRVIRIERLPDTQLP